MTPTIDRLRTGIAAPIDFRDNSVWIGSCPVRSVLLVVAHPDDEVIGAGSKLHVLPRLTIAHATDGAPRNMYDANRHGFSSRADYASARRRELQAALEIAGAVSARTVEIGFCDQTAALDLPGLTYAMAALFSAINPDIVLTHPYEGGHPDHDACAFAAHAASLLGGFDLYEFACYHAGAHGIRTGEFLGPASDATTVELSPGEQERKQQAFRCFETQQETLSTFTTALERFRPAPTYRFTQRPHDGQLYYERFDWGMTGARFSALARSAINNLGIDEEEF